VFGISTLHRPKSAREAATIVRLTLARWTAETNLWYGSGAWWETWICLLLCLGGEEVNVELL
jgi:hypothetical protein